MSERFIRTEMLLGKEAMSILAKSKVIVFGLGGVGGYTVEALARSGVGNLTLVDNDVISESNINRQIIALEQTVGKYKTDVCAERVLSINPDINVTKKQMFFLPENAQNIDFTEFDYIVDAIDTVSAKICLSETAGRLGIPIISSMGTGNKLNPAMLEVADIYSTSVCPLARVMRTELRKRGIKSLKVVYSKEPPISPKAVQAIQDSSNAQLVGEDSDKQRKRSIPGSTAFVPPAAGLIIASEVIKDLISSSKVNQI